LRIFAAALATPFEVSGAAFHLRTAWLRVEGLPAQVDYRCGRLRQLLGDREVEMIPSDASRSLWLNLRDLHHLSGCAGPLWRLLVKPTDAPAACDALERLGGATAIDWGGGLIWYCGPADGAAVRAAVPSGHATLLRRADLSGRAFPPQSEAVERLSASLRRRFDPAGILNPGLMDA
jgi:glycolate oxidase FAD binding subunit